ncbi:MAG: hypothetical protein PHQ52_00695 [Candidatus Omnitrophica bacterium]|nr:hypothetical protein [Candidatus Omnitrophota bacterium]
MIKKIVILVLVFVSFFLIVAGVLFSQVYKSREYADKGYFYLSNGDPQKGVVFLKEALRLNPKKTEYEVAAYNACIEYKMYKEAEDLLFSQMKRDRDKAMNFQRLNDLEKVYVLMGDLDSAKGINEILINKAGDAPAGYLGMSAVAEKQGNIKRAIENKEKAIWVMENKYDNFPQRIIKEQKVDLERLKGLKK